MNSLGTDKEIEMNIMRLNIEGHEKWRELVDKIPYIHFPEKYIVKIIPPYHGAVARFLIKNPDTGMQISVYLDFFSRLGFYGDMEPYWELYPNIDEDISRYGLNDTEKLIKEIEGLLE